MPPLNGANSRAIEARQRKANAAAEKRIAEEKRKEDASWKDDVTEAKFNKKEALLCKAQEKTNRKAEIRRLAAAEEKTLDSKGKNTGNQTTTKLTRAVIEQRALLASLNAVNLQPKHTGADSRIIEQDLPSENVNLLPAEQTAKSKQDGAVHVTASSVSEFLEAFEPEKELDKNPERRMKAAFAAYEAQWMPRLREENPTLKRSQIKDRIWKQWQKAPENPLNQQQCSKQF